MGSPAAPSFSTLSIGTKSLSSISECSEKALSHDILSIQPSKEPAQVSSWSGFKDVGDNIDKTIRPRHQTLDFQTRSLHFHAYAVKDRVDCSSLSDITHDTDLTRYDVRSLLLSQENVKELKSNFTVTITRILVAHMPAFVQYASVVPAHINNQFSEEMKKSEVVCLFVL